MTGALTSGEPRPLPPKGRGRNVRRRILLEEEGAETISFKLWEQPSSIDWVVCPAGSGVLMSAIYKGFWELKKLKLLDRIPRVVGVQAEGCSPVARAWKEGLMARWSKPSTIASAIRVERPYDAPLAVKAARESGGRILTVSDREIMDALRNS